MHATQFKRLAKLAVHGERVVVFLEDIEEPIVLMSLGEFEQGRAVASKSEFPTSPGLSVVSTKSTPPPPSTETPQEDEEDLYDADRIFADIQKERAAEEASRKKPVPPRRPEADADSVFYFEN
jgi:hypothetical protein